MLVNNNGHNYPSEVRVLSLDDVKSLFDSLPLQEREKFLGETLSDLPAESQMKILGKQLGESGLIVVVGGSNCAVNTDICIQIQNAPNIDVEAIIETVVARRQRDRSGKG